MKRQNMQDSMITTSSATVGGLTKAFVLGFAQPTITFPQILEVSVYAAISATIGYVTKMIFDALKAKIKQRKSKNNEILKGIQNEIHNETTDKKND